MAIESEEALELRLALLQTQLVLYDIRDLLAFNAAIANVNGGIPTNSVLKAMRTLLQALHAEQAADPASGRQPT